MDEATTLVNLSPENGRTAFSYRKKEHVCRKSWTNISASLFAASKVSRKNMALITLMTSIHIAISGPMASQLHLINSAMWKISARLRIPPVSPSGQRETTLKRTRQLHQVEWGKNSKKRIQQARGEGNVQDVEDSITMSHIFKDLSFSEAS
jgi:hypothetical protein